MEYIKEYTKLTPQEYRQLAYKRRFKRDQPAWDDSMIRLRDWCGTYIPRGATLLDFGCGRGNFVIDELKGHFGATTGIDVSTEATEGNISVDRVAIAPPGALPFPDASFDAVVSLWVLEHLPRPVETFADIARVLKPGGYFAFVTPNKKSLLVTLRRLMPDKLSDRLTSWLYGRTEDDIFDVYYRANTAQDIAALAKQSGFHIAVLEENADPSYTSFNTFTYRLSSFFSCRPSPFFKPHLIGMLKKR